MNRREFIELAVEKGLPKERIQEAMAARRSKLGAFDDDLADSMQTQRPTPPNQPEESWAARTAKALAPLSYAASQQPAPTPKPYDATKRPSSFADMAGATRDPSFGAAPIFDALSLPARALATTRGMEMSDPSANFFNPEIAQAEQNAKSQNEANPWNGRSPTSFADFGQNAFSAPGEAILGTAGDPMSYTGVPSQAIAKLNPVIQFRGAIAKAGPGIKKYIAGLAEVDPAILEKAATPEGLKEILIGARTNRQTLAEDIAGTTNSINESRARTVSEANAKNALENQGLNERAKIDAQQANDRAALENQSVNSQYQNKAEAENAQRQALFSESQNTQRQQATGSILDARNRAVSNQDGEIYFHGSASGYPGKSAGLAQLSKDPEIAKMYAGKTGKAFSVKPGSAKQIDLTSKSAIDDIAQKLHADYENGRLYDLASEMEYAAGVNRGELTGEDFNKFAESFNPKNIVNSAEAWDNQNYVDWFIRKYDADFVKTSDGGISLNPKSAEFIDLSNKRSPISDVSSLGDIKPGKTGEELGAAMQDARGIQLDQWQQGNKSALAPLSEAKAATTVKRVDDGTFRAKKVLTQNFASTLGKYKALKNEQGMRSISEGAQGAGKHLIGYSENNGHTLDDLVNIKREIQRVQSGGNYRGAPFDNTNDVRFFGDMNQGVDRAIIETVKKASPKNAAQLINMSRAMAKQYEKTTRMLGEFSRGANQTKSSADVIGQVAALGPTKARALIQESLNNPAIASVVPKMRQAFVDDILASSMENGEINFAKMAARWNNPKFQEIKSAWLSPEQIKNFDDGLALGLAKIKKPGIVAPNKVPMPDKQYPYSIPSPEKIPEPKKVGGRLLQNGEANVPVIKEKLGTMGGERPGNENDLASLQALDKIAGTNYAEQVRPIYEADQLGMDDAGRMSTLPKSPTGRSGLSAHIGKLAGALVGGPMGFLVGQGAGAGGGAVLGGFAGDAIQAAVMHTASPSGAVQAFRLVNKIAESKYPRSAKIAAAIRKTTDPARKAALMNVLNRTLESEMNDSYKNQQGAKP